ncbi:hypothetical protein J40TS1_43090 [Paenibacillus montaniterrae]|uniref:Uncharacterized protein n=1 Tax=Paenibacillus montaniterrae TaxID=429341 RepID=A0A920CVX6_9BACL|nr:hypothetical protein [Paenibacillus montaniterrae]GIP18667.1 hypothetical protein J40TS1_43090 [Paenibacillus montaniterrae]
MIDYKRNFKKVEKGFYIAIVGSTLVVISFIPYLGVLELVCFFVGWTMVFMINEIEKYIDVVKEDGVKMKNTMGSRVSLKSILLTALGFGFIIFALIDILEFYQLFLFVVGIALLLFSFRLNK